MTKTNHSRYDMSSISAMIRQEVSKVLGVDSDQILPNTPLVEYGLDSLRAMKIIANIEDRFGIEASDIDIAMLHSVADLTAYVERKQTEDCA